MTIRELFRELAVAHRRREDEHDQRVTLAWQIEALHRRRKLPSLTSLLTRRAAQPQTVTQQRTMLHILSAQYGLPLRTGRSRRRRPDGH